MIGIDLVNITTFTNACAQSPKILEVILHKEEMYLVGNSESMAGRFAGKEAILKSGCGPNSILDFPDLLLRNRENGIEVEWKGSRLEVAISITHEVDYVVAVAVNLSKISTLMR